MGLFDSIKNAAEKAGEKAAQLKAEATEKAEQKKAEQEALNAEMSAKIEEIRNKIISDIEDINAGNAGVFETISDNELMNFTKEFAERLYLPANTSSSSSIIIYPYITDKNMKNIHSTFEFDDNAEKVILYVKTSDKQEILLTTAKLYFKIILPDNKKFTAIGVVDTKMVNELNFAETEIGYSFRCDSVELVSFKLDKKYKQDFITLNNYFDRLRTKQFTISADDVHSLVREKVGTEICNMFEKYYGDGNEKIIFFAWGSNSYSAKDYVICTDKQVIIMDRAMGGSTMNVKQLYYDDITSAQLIQNTNTGSLAADLISTAITVGLDIADLVINAAGAEIRILNLYKKEVERIIAIYHEMRRELKNKNSQPVIQQVSSPAVNDPLEQLQKLSKLKEAGIISEEEFNQKKADLLSKI